MQQRIFHVFGGRQHRQQVEGLEDETDGARAQLGELIGRAPADILIVDVDLAAARSVDAANQVQERRLAAARRSGDRQKTPGSNARVMSLRAWTFCSPSR
jgi:hypothetical protein